MHPRRDSLNEQEIKFFFHSFFLGGGGGGQQRGGFLFDLDGSRDYFSISLLQSPHPSP